MNKLLLFARKSNQLPIAQKRKFLDSHPAKQLALPKNVDCSAFGHGYDMTATGEYSTFLSDSVEKVLLTHWQTNIKNRESCMDYRAQEASRFLEEHSRANSGDRGAIRLKQMLQTVTDRIYSNIYAYKTQLNQVTGGSELYISHTAPEEVTEYKDCSSRSNLNHPSATEVTYLRFRFSSGVTSLVARAKADKIEFFLIPSSQVMSLSQIEDQYSPFIAMQIRCRSGSYEWRVEGDGLRFISIEDFSLFVIDKFMDQSKIELSKCTNRNTMFERSYTV